MGLAKVRNVVIALALALVLVLPASAANPPLLTTAFTPGTPLQTTFRGSPAVAINYTDSLSGPILALVWLSVHNSLGQTVGIFVATASTSGGATVPVYVLMSGLATGHYTASVFAVTPGGVPISTTSTLSINL